MITVMYLFSARVVQPRVIKLLYHWWLSVNSLLNELCKHIDEYISNEFSASAEARVGYRK